MKKILVLLFCVIVVFFNVVPAHALKSEWQHQELSDPEFNAKLIVPNRPDLIYALVKDDSGILENIEHIPGQKDTYAVDIPGFCIKETGVDEYTVFFDASKVNRESFTLILGFKAGTIVRVITEEIIKEKNAWKHRNEVK